MSFQSDYKRLEYIQSSGTQYIDTGFKPTGATKIVCDFQMVNQGTNQQGVFGSRPGTSGRLTVFTGNGIADLQVDYNTEQTLASVGSSITGLNVNSRTTLELSNSLVINGTTVKTVSVASFTSTYNLFLFANNNAGTAQLPGILKLYSCQIYDNGTLVRDFIPCKNTGGAVGLWDDVNSVFYGNAGTGTFTAGPYAVPEMPERLTASVNGSFVTLTWSESNDATGYKISRNGVKIADQTALSFTDTVDQGQTYVYTVVAYNGNGDSEPAKLTVQTPPGAPTTLYQTMAVRLAWSSVSSAERYNIYRNGKLLGTTTGLFFVDDTAAENTEYTYAVSAVNPGGESAKTTLTVYTKSGYFLYKPYIESATFQ